MSPYIFALTKRLRNKKPLARKGLKKVLYLSSYFSSRTTDVAIEIMGNQEKLIWFCLLENGIKYLFPVQSETFETIYEGSDVVVQASKCY